MAATDQNYRSQRTLDIVFAVSCVLMLVSVFWMFAQDYNREFKKVQREFRDVDEALTQRAMLDKLPDKEKVEAASTAVTQARQELNQTRASNRAGIQRLLVEKAQQEAAAQSAKADYDSIMSLYAIATDERDEASDDKRRQELQRAVDQRRQQVDNLAKQLSEAQVKLENTLRELKTRQETERQAEKALSDKEDELKKVAGEFNRFAKAAAQKSWKWGDAIRKLPVIDGFASPVKIQQYTLNEYPIDYSFKYVTRYDRCTTCHLGMERPTFTKAALTGLAHADQQQQDKLNTARELVLAQARDPKTREMLGFDSGDLPTQVATMDLSKSQVNEYCAHPRLDLFVDANSPHPAEKFGCTSCHAGQGSATDFLFASHVPTNAQQKEEWTKQLGWEANHFWDYPMLAMRFAESACLKCHHQVTDLIRYGNKLEAPKLIKGYELVRENGCFGCHEIAGLKSNREVGPDLRLEPSPPLEAYTPGERAKMLSDAENPPGTMRKVGPSLYRIAEKTNQHWARRWIQAPRGFRPTTKMPHFYGLSNNDPTLTDALPEDQKEFPDAEITSITYYVFHESQDYLAGTDKYRGAWKARLKELQNNQLRSELDTRVMEELARRLELDKDPVPLAKELHDSEGRVISLPAAPKDAKGQEEQRQRGRQLFTERGCLACHSHSATTKADAQFPAVDSDANFAPDLSRLAAKIAPENGDAEARRRWLVQWILDPKIHWSRTRMPVTHLNPEQASEVAAWLLNQPAEGWDAQQDLAAPSSKALADLARVYLLKAPGMTHQDVDEILQSTEGDKRKGLADVSHLPLDADERQLAGPIGDDQLKWYIGRKAITRLGCFGCHDVPGFSTSKPIGTALNDWGKKDPERLAFEDIVSYVKKHYRPVDQIIGDKGHGAAMEEGQKPPYERFFFEALEHHERGGFLHQKLVEPRSYDYDRLRTWDDRLRMPQFKFARGHIKPLEGETQQQAEVREEAEAREAVMTFILGLVAEPVPSKYLHDPTGDKLAEARGRQVIEKYNCAGCHQIRSGVYELTPNSAQTTKLEEAYTRAINGPAYAGDYRTRMFLEHNAWTGLPSPYPDRLMLYGIPAPPPPDTEPGQEFVRLTQALRFTDSSKQVRDIPAAEYVDFSTKDAIAQAEPLGGRFTNLLVHAKYLNKRDPQKYQVAANGESPDARAALPPPLLREGEKTQPAWLFQFLRNPFEIRPTTILRMPRFNMSDDEAMDLVNYFAAVDRLNNPGIGVNYPYISPMPQRQEGFWQQQSGAYVATLKQKNLLQKHLDELKPLWAVMQTEQLAEAEAALKDAKDAEAKETDKEKKKTAAAAVKTAEAQVALVKDRNAFEKAQQEGWESKEAYATDAYRLLASNDLCLNCHQVGPLTPKQPIGPPLNLAVERLRSDWLLRWIASPQRLLIYPDGQHPMPQNFKSDGTPWPQFTGTMLDQVIAVRDVLIDYPRVSTIPANRAYRPPSGGGK
jgi:mono/diheme cytochrome c family protein